jgi:anti-anti-sigma regulatory factor
MNLTEDRVQTPVPITIVRIQGDVDGSNYRQLIDRMREIHTAGARRLLIDLAGVPFMSSAGLVALHSIAQLFQEKPLPNTEDGWGAIRALEHAAKDGKQPFVKLLHPQPRVATVLDQTGLLPFFDVHTDEAAALASF